VCIDSIEADEKRLGNTLAVVPQSNQFEDFKFPFGERTTGGKQSFVRIPEMVLLCGKIMMEPGFPDFPCGHIGYNYQYVNRIVGQTAEKDVP
jgi:hypothetical protein